MTDVLHKVLIGLPANDSDEQLLFKNGWLKISVGPPSECVLQSQSLFWSLLSFEEPMDQSRLTNTLAPWIIGRFIA